LNDHQQENQIITICTTKNWSSYSKLTKQV